METVPQDRNRPDVIDARRAYAGWYLEVTNMEQPPELIYVDESGFNLWTARTRGRAHRGVRAVRVVHGQRGGNFTLILAVSSRRGIVHSDFFQGGTNAQRFNQWLQDAAAAAGDQPAIFVMDNAPCHRHTQDAGAVKLLPPYSPFLNIAENAFSIWKASFKRELAEVREEIRNQDAGVRQATLVQLGQQNLAAITPLKMAAATRAMVRLMPRLLNAEAIADNHA